MIESIDLYNFQRFKKLTVTFSPTVTTLIGDNDAGKSAVLRALRYNSMNKPRGVAHVRHGATLCSVTMKIDGRRVRRISGKKNVYSLDGKKFKAFRNEVPREIANLINVTEINFQRQHDPVFWLSLSPGTLARELNRLVDLQTIDAVQAWVVKRLRVTSVGIDVCTRRKEQAEAVLRSLKNVKNLEKILTKLRKLHENELPQLLKHAGGIRTAIENVVELRASIANAGRLAADEQALSTTHAQLTRENMTIAALRRVLTHCAACHRALRRVVNQPALDALTRHAHAMQQGTTRRTGLRQLVVQASHITKEIELCKQHEIEQKQIIEEKLNGRCPLCYGILTDQSPV